MPSLILALACLCAACAGTESSIVYQVDFGPKGSCAPGCIAIQPDSTDPRFFWKGRGLSMRDRGGDDLLRRDFVCGIRAELWVGLENGRYEIDVYYYHEAILWVWHWTADQALKDKIRRVYG